jgi:hypothetical protein
VGGRRRRRRPDARAVALLLGLTAAPLVVARIYHLGVPATLVSLLLSVGVPAAWEAVRRGGKPAGTAASVADDADEFAGVVKEQWLNEIANRRFNDPTRNLTVSWTAADAELTVGWDALVALASRRPGQHALARQRNWAAGPDRLAGFEDELPTVLQRVPTGWLVVLGGPGYGKSTLMIRLAIDLLERRDGGPVPVLVPMASWDPERSSLYGWLEERLPIDYPGLDTMVSNEDGQSSRIGALLAERKILPILDGLDEMPIGARIAAIGRLNEALGGPAYPLQLVMTCRTDDYREAVGRPGEHRNLLRGAAAIELCPLDRDLVAAYLAERGEDVRWVPVLTALTAPGSPLATTLRTPLYVSLASAIYNPHVYTPRAEIPEPADLCAFATSKAVEEHLLDSFIPAVYRGDRRAAEPDPRPLPAERWLMFVASYLTGRKVNDLQWWDLRGIAPRALVPAVIGSICGLAVAVAAATGTHVGVGIGVGFGVGMLIALAVGLGTRHLTRVTNSDRYRKRYGDRRPGPGMAGGLIGAAVGGLAAGVAGRYGIGHQASLFSGLPEALGIGIGAGASTEFLGGLVGSLLGSFVAGYLAAVGLGLAAGVTNGLGVGLAAGLAVHYVGRSKPARRWPTWVPEVGLVGGCVIGLATGVVAWREEGAIAGAVAGVLVGAAAAVPFGFRHTEEDLTYVPTPAHALTRDRSAFRFTAWAAGLAAGVAGFVGGSLTAIFEVGATISLPAVVSDGLGIGLSSGLVIGLTFGFYHGASPGFHIINWWLALHRKAPWRLRRFLEDAYDRSVLRQSGAVYQFRHDILQDRLASRLAQQRPRAGAGGNRPDAAAPRRSVIPAGVAPDEP